MCFQPFFAQFDYERDWGTYFGNAGITVVSHKVDSAGNLYLAGTTKHSFPDGYISENAFQTSQSFGFLIKMNQAGDIVWGTYINGDVNDMYIHPRNNTEIVLLGYTAVDTAETTVIASPEAYQTTMEARDIFLLKFDTEGNRIWGTYYNTGGIGVNYNTARMTIALDSAGAIYFSHRTGLSTLGTAGTFQSEQNGINPTMLTKFSAEGYKIWSTYYGINGSNIQTVSVSSSGIFVKGFARDCQPYNNPNTYFATPEAYEANNQGSCATSYLSMFNFDGQRIWSTYFKGLVNIKADGNSVYVNSSTAKPSLITTGTFQQTNDASSGFLGKFSDLGQPVWGTNIGLDGGTIGVNTFFFGSFGIQTDATGNLYLYGGTKHESGIASSDGYLTTNPSQYYGSSFIMKFNPLGQRLWGTYYGGAEQTFINSINITNDSFYITGITICTEDIATENSLEPDYILSAPNYAPYNGFIARFIPSSLSINQNDRQSITIAPNPSQGSLYVSGLPDGTSTISLYDVVGKKILEQNIINSQEVNTTMLSKGIYIAKVKTDNTVLYTQKVILN